MKLSQKSIIMMSVGLTLALLGGCGGGGGSDDEKSTTDGSSVEDGTSTDDSPAGTDNTDTTNSGAEENSGNSNNVTATYTVGNGVLIETKSDNTKLAWVNTTEDRFCKISRPTDSDRTGTVYQAGVAHCQNLASQNYASINSWRLPSIKEAKYLMNLDNRAVLIFPTSNKNCAIMTTNIENTFVYTTSDWNIRDNNPIGGEFINNARNNGIAGIRCVATRTQ